MKRLFNDGWEFCKQPLETSLEQVQKKMQGEKDFECEK